LIAGLDNIVREELTHEFGSSLPHSDMISVVGKVCAAIRDTLDTTNTMDTVDRMQKVAASSTAVLLDFVTGPTFSEAIAPGSVLKCISAFGPQISYRVSALHDRLRGDYLSGQRGAAPASLYLTKTRPMYDYIRLTLGIRMHGSENYTRFVNGLGVEDVTIGQNISLIHEVCWPLVCFHLLTSHFRLSGMARCKKLLLICFAEGFHT
jgi:phenylalanine ammonia-lyase